MKLKRLLSILLTMAMVAGLFAVPGRPVEAGSGPEVYWTDVAIEPDYDPGTNAFIISSAEELAWVALQTNENGMGHPGFTDYTIMLACDIDLAGRFWVPIGDFYDNFQGTFDGNGHTISNMTIGTPETPESELSFIGLFGYTYRASIYNVNLTGVYINADSSTADFAPQIGAIAGCIVGSIVEGCSADGYIRGEYDSVTEHGIGGLIGEMAEYNNFSGTVIPSSVSDSHADCIIIADGDMTRAGGLIGCMSPGSNTVADCYATGSVSGSGARYIGGLIGWAYGTITDCYATGNVIGSGESDAGGLIGVCGVNSFCEIENCFATGDVTEGLCVGGLVGSAGNGSITNCYALGYLTSSGIVGGLIGYNNYTGSCSITNSYSSCNITTTQASPINQNYGGLVGLQITDDDAAVTYGYWNKDKVQVVNGAVVDTESRIGIKYSSEGNNDTSIKMSDNEMTDVRFAQLLNDNRGTSREWATVSGTVYGINGGYPFLDGLHFNAPANTVTVTFKSDEDDYKIINVVPGDTIEPPAEPAWVHHEFAGWYTTAELDTPFDFAAPITSDTTIYAKWEEIPTYLIEYDLNEGEGTVPDGGVYEEGDVITLPFDFDFEREDYVFKGWTTSSDGTGVLYFPGDSYTVVGNTTFYAKWEQTYKVTYDANGGNGDVPEDSYRYESGDTVYIPYGVYISKDGFRFAGWTTSSDGTGELYDPGDTYTVVGNTTFYAKWEPLRVCTVTFDLNGGIGDIPDGEDFLAGDIIYLPSGEGLTKEGYRFAGWIDTDGNIYFPYDHYEVYENVTFYAIWISAWMDSVDIINDKPDFDEETGTFTISNASELAWVAYYVNVQGDDFSGMTIRMAENIDLGGKSWIPIGVGFSAFAGAFDGNGHTISNLTIGSEDIPDNMLDYAGLFGYVYDAEIRDVSLEGIEIYSSKQYVKIGGLAGYAEYSSITGCNSTGTIQGDDDTSVGGLLGYAHESDISDSFSSANVNVRAGFDDYAYAGGLAGCVEYSNITGCSSTGTIQGDDYASVGGLLGYAYESNISDSLSSANVTGGYNANVGGLAGCAECSSIASCNSTGTIQGDDDTSVGGLLGYAYESNISDSFSSANVNVRAGFNDYTCAGGLTGYVEYSSITGCSSTGTIQGYDNTFLGGLLGYAYESDISDSFSSADVKSDYYTCAGVLAGYAEDSSITGCSSTGTAQGGNGAIVGGLLGCVYDCDNISNSHSSADVEGGYSANVGGFAGAAIYSNITGCSSTGTARCGDEAYVGGLLGWTSDSNVSNSHSSADVEGGYYAGVGGLVGHAMNSEITGCSSTGTARGGDIAAVGGLAGFAPQSSILDNYALGDVKGGDEAFVGGLLGVAIDCAISNNYATGNVEGGLNSVVGGFAGRYELDEAGYISYGYWNSEAEQVIGETGVEFKKGIGEDTSGLGEFLISKTSDEMKSDAFAELLDENKYDEDMIWTIVAGVNGGYPIFAEPFGTITGTVTDGTNPIPGAGVFLSLGEDVCIMTDTDENGSYTITGIDMGNGYTVTSSAVGYLSSIVTDVTVAPGQTTIVNLVLPVDPAQVEYQVNIGIMTGGTISASPTTAKAGETINLVITPDAGKMLKEGSLKYNDGTDHIIEGDSFIMPAADVVVTAEFEDVPPPTLESITITTPANKLVYIVGETLDITGMVVTGHYSDGSTKVETITVDNVTGFNSSAPAVEQVLTVTVGSKTATYTITINAAPVVTYTVTFDKNGGDTEANPADMTVVQGGSTGVLPEPPQRNGYTFKGWNTAADGSGSTFTGSTTVSSDITVYAQWEKDNNGGDDGSGGGDDEPGGGDEPGGNGDDEPGSGNSGEPGGSGDSQPSTPGTGTTGGYQITTSTSGNTATAATTATASTDGSGKATANVTRRQMNDTVTKAVEEAQKLVDAEGVANTRVEIKVEAPEDVKTVEAGIPKEAVQAMTEGDINKFTVSTPIASITFDAGALSTISQEAGGDISITVSEADTSSLPDQVQETIGDRPVFNFNVTSGDKSISKFNGYVEVSVPYTPKEGEDTDSIIIYYINAQGELEIVTNCSYDPVAGTVTFRTNHFSYYAVGYNKVVFNDVDENAWYGNAVNFIAARGITKGTGNGNYRPESDLTRGEFIVMVMRAYGIGPDENPADNFADAGNTYYTGYLAAAKRLGISRGTGNNRFSPDREITRQEMFTLLYNILSMLDELPEGEKGKSLSSFSDADQVADWAKEAIDVLAKAGIVNGSGGGKLMPGQPANRAQMAQLLYNLLK